MTQRCHEPNPLLFIFQQHSIYKLVIIINIIFQLLLLHIDDVILKAVDKEGLKQPTGCSSIALNLKDNVSM